MSAQLALLCVDVATIAFLALFGLRVASVPTTPLARGLIALLCLAGIAHVALARAEYAWWIPEPYRFTFASGTTAVLDVTRNTAPGLFALLTYVLFTDRDRPPLWLFALLLLQIALESVGGDLLSTASALLHVVFAACAVYWTVGYWRADLVEARRRARAIVSLILAVNVVASSILLRLVIPSDSLANYQAHVVLSIAMLGVIVLLFFRLMDGEIGTPLRERTGKARVRGDTRKSEDELALRRLEALLREKQLHHEPGLSLKALADRVGLPEYRMRQLIHEQLGHRNFNAFLHSYRIRDAVAQLRNADMHRASILSIAQSVGYDSINTFNRAFKEIMGVTPSQYRQANVAADASDRTAGLVISSNRTDS